jgi:hypothetical protein
MIQFCDAKFKNSKAVTSEREFHLLSMNGWVTKNANTVNFCFLTGEKESIQQQKKIKLVLISFHVKIWEKTKQKPWF